MSALIALLVTVTMAGVDFCHARYTRAMMGGHVMHAALWSVGQWGAASVGFVVAVKVSMWYLPFEALGLFLGTLLGARSQEQASDTKGYVDDVSRTRKNEVSCMPAKRGGVERKR